VIRDVGGWPSGLELLILAAYDRMVGLHLSDLATDGCSTKAPCGGQHARRSPVDRGKQGPQALGRDPGPRIPLGAVRGRANAHDSLLLAHLGHLGAAGSHAHPAHGAPGPRLPQRQDRRLLTERGMTGQIAERGQPAPVQASRRWAVGRTNAWQPVQEAGLEHRTL
jgi:hypothetical protein